MLIKKENINRVQLILIIFSFTDDRYLTIMFILVLYEDIQCFQI